MVLKNVAELSKSQRLAIHPEPAQSATSECPTRVIWAAIQSLAYLPLRHKLSLLPYRLIERLL